MSKQWSNLALDSSSNINNINTLGTAAGNVCCKCCHCLSPLFCEERYICESLKVTGIICYTNVANYTAQESQSRESEPDVEEIYMRKMKRGFVN